MIICIITYWINIPQDIFNIITVAHKVEEYKCFDIKHISVGKAVLSDGDKFDLELGKRIARIKAETTAYKLAHNKIYDLYQKTINMADKAVFKFKTKTEGVVRSNNEYIDKVTK